MSDDRQVPDPGISPDDLVRLDAALMRLRRLWTAPRTHDGMRADVGTAVELSTVLVVDAVAEGPGADGATCGVAEVAHRVDVAPSTASRLVERAVAAGMVERRQSATDARRADLRLSGAGRALHERAQRFRAGYLGHVLADWSSQDVTTLATGLAAFADAVAEDRPAPGTCPAT